MKSLVGRVLAYDFNGNTLFEMTNRVLIRRSVSQDGLRSIKAQLLPMAVCALLACILCACHDARRESFYAALADAKRDGAIDRGWISDMLPGSSHTIHELHENSPSLTWCALELLRIEPSNHRRAKPRHHLWLRCPWQPDVGRRCDAASDYVRLRHRRPAYHNHLPRSNHNYVRI